MKKITVLLSLTLAMVLAGNAEPEPAYTELISPNPRANGGFGSGFGALPDLTGDGIGEFYVQAEGEGRIYIYDGENLKLLDQIGLSGCTGIGYELMPAGDLRGDGTTEFMVHRRGCGNLSLSFESEGAFMDFLRGDRWKAGMIPRIW